MSDPKQRRSRAPLPCNTEQPHLPTPHRSYRPHPQLPTKPPVSHFNFNPAATEFVPPGAFWHQSTAGLYYSPYIGMCHQMVPQAMFALHGTKTRAGVKARLNRDRRNPPHQETVDVYNDESFIKAVPLKTLVRFSAVAARKFALPGQTLPRRMARSRDSKGQLSTSKNWASGTATTSSDSDSEPTERSTPLFALPKRNSRKQLVLFLEGAENPSNETVLWTLKWMMDNADSNDTLIPYAPDLHRLDFEHLVDFYQASLMVELLPVPRHIPAALMQRVTDQPPTTAMLQSLSSYIPAGSAVTDRAITSFFRHRSDGEYSYEQLEEFEDLMNAKGNESIRQRRDYIFSVITFKKGGGRSGEQEERRGRANSAARKGRKLAQKDWRQGSNFEQGKNANTILREELAQREEGALGPVEVKSKVKKTSG